jgi:hypothetical protein
MQSGLHGLVLIGQKIVYFIELKKYQIQYRHRNKKPGTKSVGNSTTTTDISQPG